MVVKYHSKNRIQRMSTWEILTEVDKIMSHVPEWKAFDWYNEDKMRKINYEYCPRAIGKKIRKRKSNGRF